MNLAKAWLVCYRGLVASSSAPRKATMKLNSLACRSSYSGCLWKDAQRALISSPLPLQHCNYNTAPRPSASSVGIIVCVHHWSSVSGYPPSLPKIGVPPHAQLLTLLFAASVVGGEQKTQCAGEESNAGGQLRALWGRRAAPIPISHLSILEVPVKDPKIQLTLPVAVSIQ